MKQTRTFWDKKRNSLHSENKTLVPGWDTLMGRDPPLGNHWCEARRKKGQDAKHILGSVRVEGAGMCTIVSSVWTGGHGQFLCQQNKAVVVVVYGRLFQGNNKPFWVCRLCHHLFGRLLLWPHGSGAEARCYNTESYCSCGLRFTFLPWLSTLLMGLQKWFFTSLNKKINDCTWSLTNVLNIHTSCYNPLVKCNKVQN